MKHTWKRLLGVSLALMLLLGCLSLGGFADDLEFISAEQYLTTIKPDGADDLKFNEDGSFKIIQLSDLQETFFSSCMTADFIKWLAETEKPDLFVLTGDNSASPGLGVPFIDRFVINQSIDSFMNVFDEVGIPVTMVLGNHDVEKTNVTRWQAVQRYQAHKSYIGYGTASADGSDGAHWGTHCLTIKDFAGTTDKFALWMFDSGSYVTKEVEKEVEVVGEDGETTTETITEIVDDGYDCVSTAQVNWFSNNSLKGLPGFTFQHIPVIEVFNYLDPIEPAPAEGLKWKLPAGTKGVMRENPCPSKYNYGQFVAVSATDSGVLAMFFGHDHVNTFELETDGAMLVNSPTSGFGSYGDKDLRGVRVITLDADDLTTFETKIVTYEDFVDANGTLTSLLQGLRLSWFDWRGLPGWVLDWLFFVPSIWFFSLLGL